MSIRNISFENITFDIFCKHINCGDIDIINNNIDLVNNINTQSVFIKDMNVYDYIKELEIKQLTEKNELQNQINELKNIINELTNINLNP